MGLVDQALNSTAEWDHEMFGLLSLNEGGVESIDYEGLPESLRPGMKLWIDDGILPGSFLTAVIMDDLKEAVFTADDENIILLARIVKWCHWQLPMRAWGSQQNVKEWHERRKMEWAARQSEGTGEGP